MNNKEWNRVRQFAAWGLVGLIILIGASIAISLIFSVPRSSGTFYYPFFFPFQFGWLGGIFLIFIIFWIVIRWFFWPWRSWDYRQYSQYRGGDDDDAHNIRRERYARSKITKEQYEQMRSDLEHKG
jgi:uncharacterized membrane protein